METYTVLQLIHVLAATVWVGGHIALALGFLPEALRRRDPRLLMEFERVYGRRVGLPSLVIAAATGIAMAHSYSGWFSEAWPIGAKLALFALLIAIIVLGRHELHGGEQRLGRFAIHVWAVTIISVLFVVLGWHLRFGIF